MTDRTTERVTEDALDRIAEEHGIELGYLSETGEYRLIHDDVKRALLASMTISASTIDVSSIPAQMTSREIEREEQPLSSPPRCFLPRWLDRSWGISAQLYGVASSRNLGVGDFEDVARLAEIFAALGADFIGINPIHALFGAAPSRTSPYYPSSRQFLNPIYIAVDQVPGTHGALDPGDLEEVEALRQSPFVEYRRVAALKRRLLQRLFHATVNDLAFDAFRREEGRALDDFATFEALSEWFVQQGASAGWHGWPEPYRAIGTAEVGEFQARHEARIRFHAWLQWIARRQLDRVQSRALRAGMRIGLYLDLAVGVAPDGAATWSRPQDYATDARIGAPPDLFNHAGQDWGLSPIRPAALGGSAVAPSERPAFERDVASTMRSAGALRIDHAMGLHRLYWIPRGFSAATGGYVRYPQDQLVACLARQSQANRTIIIGEDLGTVAPGFRDAMGEAGILSYRVLYFERTGNGVFTPPAEYPDLALACLSTHDLPPVGGWWLGRDITTREALGAYLEGRAVNARAERTSSRRHLIDALSGENLLEINRSALTLEHDPGDLPHDLFVALHAFGARTPSKLFAIQLEDLAGAIEHVNLPGTQDEHPNWCRKLPIDLEQLASSDLVRETVEAVRRERPQASK